MVLAAIFAAFAAYHLYSGSQKDATSIAITGAVLYALAYALGWIVAGFAEDADSNSN